DCAGAMVTAARNRKNAAVELALLNGGRSFLNCNDLARCGPSTGSFSSRCNRRQQPGPGLCPERSLQQKCFPRQRSVISGTPFPLRGRGFPPEREYQAPGAVCPAKYARFGVPCISSALRCDFLSKPSDLLRP